MLECRPRHQPWRGLPCRSFILVQIVEKDQEPVYVDEGVGLGMMQVMWEVWGCGERVAQWDKEPHASRSGGSKVIIQLTTHPHHKASNLQLCRPPHRHFCNPPPALPMRALHPAW